MAQYAVYTAEGRKRRTIYGKTRAEVAKKLAKALSDREGGLVFDDKGLTVKEYLERWLKDSVREPSSSGPWRTMSTWCGCTWCRLWGTSSSRP